MDGDNDDGGGCIPSHMECAYIDINGGRYREREIYKGNDYEWGHDGNASFSKIK